MVKRQKNMNPDCTKYAQECSKPINLSPAIPMCLPHATAHRKRPMDCLGNPKGGKHEVPGIASGDKTDLEKTLMAY